MSRKKVIRELRVDQAPNKFVEIYVSYDIGGMNYFQGVSEKRGYYLHVTPVEKGNGWRITRGFSGVKTLIKDAKRFSQKVFDAIVPDESLIDEMVLHVLNKNNLTIKEWPQELGK